MPYQFLEEIAIADIAFEAWGETLEETFISAADATMNVMVENLDSIWPRERREFHLQNDQLDLLLFDFLQEFIYFKDSEKLMLRVCRIHIQDQNKPYTLEASVHGETLNPERHHPRVDVKAVTLHRFRLEKIEVGWKALVILDV